MSLTSDLGSWFWLNFRASDWFVISVKWFAKSSAKISGELSGSKSDNDHSFGIS